MYYNRIILAGKLTKEPEIKYTSQGFPICTICLFVSTKKKEMDETLFMDVVLLGRLAETASERLARGSFVLVEGRLREQRWESSDGVKKKKLEAVAETVKFISTGQSPDEEAEED